MRGAEAKVNQRLYFKDGSWSDRPCIVVKIDGEDIYFKGEHGKMSHPFSAEWLSPTPPETTPERSER
jgi:hypothetical protein